MYELDLSLSGRRFSLPIDRFMIRKDGFGCTGCFKPTRSLLTKKSKLYLALFESHRGKGKRVFRGIQLFSIIHPLALIHENGCGRTVMIDDILEHSVGKDH